MIRVLIIDDSAFARKVIRESLSRDPEIEVVGIARDGLEGLEKIQELQPDVVTLDLMMPDLDGIGLLEALPKNSMSKVVIVSVSNAENDVVLHALQLGAVDLVTKPTALATDRLYDLSNELLSKVKLAANARTLASPSTCEKTVSSANSLFSETTSVPPPRIVVIGTSTGGPRALTSLFSSLPAGLPVPLLIALHIPREYTAPLALRISKQSTIQVVEAQNGMELTPGNAFIAPGGTHLKVRAHGDKFYAALSQEPFNVSHHPSVNVLFESAAHAAQSGALGIILTGMGDDGLLGSRAIRLQGGRILTESPESSVIYGMPRVVTEAGLANLQVPIDQMASTLTALILGQKTNESTKT